MPHAVQHQPRSHHCSATRSPVGQARPRFPAGAAAGAAAGPAAGYLVAIDCSLTAGTPTSPLVIVDTRRVLIRGPRFDLTAHVASNVAQGASVWPAAAMASKLKCQSEFLHTVPDDLAGNHKHLLLSRPCTPRKVRGHHGSCLLVSPMDKAESPPKARRISTPS